MLKLIYTDFGLHLERMTASLEVPVAQRVLLSLRAGQTLHVEPGKASFLLPADVTGLRRLMDAIDSSQIISVAAIDDGFVEVSLRGHWIAESAEAHEGMFLASFSELAEFLVEQLWQASQFQMSTLSR
jgi:hypothetical protein